MESLSKCSKNFQFADEFFYFVIHENSPFYEDTKKYVDWLFGIFLIIGSCCIVATVKRGFWKLAFIENNKKLIKDEDWKNIHMKIPRLIV